MAKYIGAIDQGTRDVTDALLDNRRFSIQDTLRGGAEEGLEVWTGEEWNKHRLADASQDPGEFRHTDVRFSYSLLRLDDRRHHRGHDWRLHRRLRT